MTSNTARNTANQNAQQERGKSAQAASSEDLFRNSFKRIRLREQNPKVADSISKEYGLSSVASRILAARGFKPGVELKNYLDPTLRNGIPAPKELKNLDKASALIAKTVKGGGSVAICCDFDVDGLSGGAQLYHYLLTAGAKVSIFVPDRFTDGYGLNLRMVEAIAKQGFSLIVTIDYGTTNKVELNRARELGIPSIVLDHHHVAENPPADVFVNPKQKGCGFAGEIMCASGLTWYLLVALSKELPLPRQIDVKEYLDLAALGTICDMVPLVGVNRVLARRGLECLTDGKRVGIKALKDKAGLVKSVNCGHVGFAIGPRLNAAGRMLNGNVVIDLLTTSDSIKAGNIARQLNDLNEERQEIEAQIKDEAIKIVEERGHLPSGIVVWGDHFHTGVIGIVAQRLVETFYRPSAVMGLDESGVYKGSVRGIKGMSVVETLTHVGKYLIKFGGHEGAGGFSVEAKKIDAFAKAFDEACAERLKGIEIEPHMEADTEASLRDINVNLIKELERFAPFGTGNRQPLLLFRKLKVIEMTTLKDAHLKVLMQGEGGNITGLMWRKTSHPALQLGSEVDVVGRPDTSTYRGITSTQLTLEAVEASSRA